MKIHSASKKSQVTLGILGGGQLGRMSAMAAARLGINVHIYCPEPNCPASQVAAKTFCAAYDDKKALRQFADSVDVISYEFENIPLETVAYLKKYAPVLPDAQLLEVSQQRLQEKQFLNDIGIPTAQWAAVMGPDEVKQFCKELNAKHCIIKTIRFGYDGKGQAKVKASDDIKKLWKLFNQDIMIAEELIDFKHEISVIVARDVFGKTVVYDPSLNLHKNHILDTSTVPSGLSDMIIKKAVSYAKKVADVVDLIGILTVEFFVTKDGKVLANEIAPRTHNSGHWTIDACAVSQFENHVRAVCGLPVGSPLRHSNAVMQNLIGDDIQKVPALLKKPNICVHDYGKDAVKAGRKMGHATTLSPIKKSR